MEGGGLFVDSAFVPLREEVSSPFTAVQLDRFEK